jgi:hypothetical protein
VSLQSDFAAKTQQLIAQSKNLSIDARKKVLEMLDATRKEIVSRLAELDPASFNATQLKVLKQQIDGLFDKFQANAIDAVDGFEAQEFKLGSETIGAPLVSIGLESSAMGQISTHALTIAQGYTADLITGLSKDAAAKVNAAIQRSFLGGQQITDVISQIGKALSGDQGFTGIFSPIGKRAVTATTNEILRVHSMAAQARLEDAVDRHPDLQKSWRHLAIAMVPRPGHLYADGQVRNVDEPFVVDGEALMYPRDPNGSPENTINCH